MGSLQPDDAVTECGHTWSTWEAGWQDHHCQQPDNHHGPCQCHCGSIHRHSDADHELIEQERHA